MSSVDDLNENEIDQLEATLSGLLRLSKRPVYWLAFTKEAGIKLDRPSVTILLNLSEQPSTFNELVIKVGIEAPAVSRKVHELIDQNLIIRQETQDRRIHLLDLTIEGRQIAERFRQAKRKLLSAVLVHIPIKERHELIKHLTQFVVAMNKQFDPASLNRKE